MKLLTLNTHSLAEGDSSREIAIFADMVSRERPEIIALQEVNQTSAEQVVSMLHENYHPCIDGVATRQDNYVYRAAELLRKKGVEYYWTWLPIKLGYGKFEEGVALLSRSPILETDIVTVSRKDDFSDWRTRKLVGIRTKTLPEEWFFSVHLGWWNDADEPFSEQWERTVKHLSQYRRVWLMGDMNSPAQVRCKGYDLMLKSGWYDSYQLAEKKDNGITAVSSIDGWRGRDGADNGMRIDLILCNAREMVSESRVVFNDVNYPVISDHYGVMVDVDRDVPYYSSEIF